MKYPMNKARPKIIKKIFQSLVMKVPEPTFVLFIELEDKFNKLKDNNLKSTMNPRVYTQNANVRWSLFEWITIFWLTVQLRPIFYFPLSFHILFSCIKFM